jgi:MFS family permease
METNETNETKTAPLWTRDFTILTLGSVVSMLGSAMSWFAMDLMVLDYTGSTLLFAVYSMVFMLPNALSPVLIGPFLDRFSRKKTIYTLDFITAGLFAGVALLLHTGHFSFWLLAGMNFLLGGINGIYGVAYDSFYPLLISEGNFRKAYSVASTLETLSAVMIPFSTLIYKLFGIVPLLIANTVSFLIAAVMETQIRTEEKYLNTRKEDDAGEKGVRRFTGDLREGLDYLRVERGLLAIAVYFFFSTLAGGMTQVVTLPWFRKSFNNGEYVYMLVWGMSSLARFLGGAAHYKLRLPVAKKFAIAYCVYIAISVLEGSYLFFPIPVMMCMTFASGMLGITSYNIRVSSTQQYVPDEKKGRFNGVFGTLNTVGMLLGEGIAGVLSRVMGERLITVIANAMCIIAAVIFIGGGKKDVAAIYNREV